MTVQNTPSFVDFVGDDVQTSFPFTFRADDVSWLSVDFTDNFDQFLLNLDQENNPGGSVEYTVAPPSPGMGGPDPSFRVMRVVPADQNLAYTRYDPFDSASHESALDKLTMILQDQVTALDAVETDLQAQIDANLLLLTTGVSPGHQHVEADIIDLGTYTDRFVDEDIVGFWEFINASGLAVYDAGKAAGGRISVQTGAIEILPLLAATHTRVNGPLHVSRAGVIADEMSITHTGLDVILAATNAGDLQLTGFTGRITQGAETYAYQSDIAAAGLLPPATDTGAMIYFDGALYNVTGSGGPGPGTMLWDPIAAQLVLTNPSGGTSNPVLQLNLGNNPSAAIQIDSTLSTNYVAFRMNDQTGANYFLWRHDYGLSTPNHELTLESSQGGTLLEFENEGNCHLGGTEGNAPIHIITTTADDQVRIDSTASIMIDGRAAAFADQGGYGQLYVLSGDGGLYYKPDGAPQVRLDVAGGVSVGASTIASSILRGDGAGGWVEGLGLRIAASGSLTTDSSISWSDGVDVMQAAEVASNLVWVTTGGFGYMDMTSIQLRVGSSFFVEGQLLPPTFTPTGFGLFWVDDTASPTRPMFRDDGSQLYELQYAQPPLFVNANQDFNTGGTARSMVGNACYYDDGANYTITLENSGVQDFPIKSSFEIINAGSGTITISEGTGMTLFYMDPTGAVTDVVGSCTLDIGGVATVFRRSTTVWLIWGGNITP